MIERLEAQKKLTANQWKLICTANIADLLDFFDFFLIGYVTAALTKEWQLPYWQGGAILLASGLGAVPGAFIWGWLGDKIGRRTVFLWSAVTISLATGIMVFTPGPSALIPGKPYNTDEQQELAGRFNIRSIPTLILFQEGRELARHSGAVDGFTLSRWLDGVLRDSPFRSLHVRPHTSARSHGVLLRTWSLQ